MKLSQFITLLLLSIVLFGCSSGSYRAPIYERGDLDRKDATVPSGEKDWRPDVYVVQKGDTMYSIAFNYGFDYHELAELNGIKDPSIISIGQQIRLFPGKAVAEAPAAAPEIKPVDNLVKEQPKLVKYRYSETALAQIENIQSKPVPIVTSFSSTVEKHQPITPKISQVITTPAVVEEGGVEWGLPAHGRVIAQYSETANRKGIDIAGKLGQPVMASASGKVVYSGSGLRGYGKLIIIKHNTTYLSAYAHNDQILVKEGQSVTRGQKIAEMGSTDADKVKLHFEVRRLGKPVDPEKYLKFGKS